MTKYFKAIMLSTENRRRFHRLLVSFLVFAIILLVGLGSYYIWASNNATRFTVSLTDIGADPVKKDRFSFSYTQSQTWPVDGTELIGAQYDCVITNNSNFTVYDWTIILSLDENVKIDGSWNGNFAQGGNAVTITPVDYNIVIPPGESIGIGMVLHTTPEFQISRVSLSGFQDRNPSADPTFRFIANIACFFLGIYAIGVFFELRILYVTSRKDRYRDLLIQSLNTISGTIDAKDPYTQGHSKRVAIYSRELARRLGFSEDMQENIYYIGLMHDIGKIGIPDEILNKSGKLTDEEFDVIRTHTTIGASILQDFTLIPEIASGAKYHHERMDGKGYPSGLKGMEIPYVARIICVADSYDAMTSSRCYRAALSADTVISELKRCSGTQFDPEIVNELLDMIEKKEVPVTLP